MSEPNDDITNEPKSGSSGSIRANKPRSDDDRDDKDRSEPPKKSKTWLIVLLSAGGVSLFLCCPVMAILVALLVPAVQKVREAAARTTSQNNVKQMMLGVANCTVDSKAGEIPPANGTFRGKQGSFFYHLLPYIEQNNVYASPSDIPIKTYIAASDSRNPNTNSTISYCTNGTVLSGTPTLPGSFPGRTSGLICIMERSGMDGAHKWTNDKTVLGSPKNPPPFPQIGADPSNYLDGSPQGFSSTGCVVGFGDGHVIIINNTMQNGWTWACDPTDKGQRPPGW